MADTTIGRIRPGASVDVADGHLGRVERVTPTAIDVLSDERHRRLVVPQTLIREVRSDGSVKLAGTVADVERFVSGERAGDEVQTLQLQEERLVANKELTEAGRVRIRTIVEEVPRHLEVDAYYEDVQIEHVPVGRIVKARESPREEDGIYIVPVYEEQLVVVKRLLLKEELHIRRQGATETRLFEDTVLRERLVVEDPDRTGRVREHYATDRPEGEVAAGEVPRDEVEPESPGLLEKLGRKVLE